LVVFPEGTTTNGHYMCRFRSGPFIAGLPVHAVAVRSPFRAFNPSWESITLPEHLWRLMTQATNRVEVHEIVPEFVPSRDMARDPGRYADWVQGEMAAVLGQPVVDLSRADKLLYHQYLVGKLSADEILGPR